MKISEKLNKLKPYVTGIRYVEGIDLVEIVLKKGWFIPKSEVVDTSLLNKEKNQHMIFSNKENITIDDLLDFAEMVINLNIERELKYELLKSKVEELKNLFKSNKLETLKNLEFDLTNRIEKSDIGDFNIDISTSDDIKKHHDNGPQIRESIENEGEYKETFTPASIPEEPKSRVIKHNNIEVELPPKKPIMVESFDENIKSVCNCKGDEKCEVCLEY